MTQQSINNKEDVDKKADEKDAVTKLPKETLILLEGMGFTEKENNPGLFVKKLSDEGSFFYWDFRPTSKKEAYVTTDDGFLPDEDVYAMEDYVIIKQKLDKKEKIEKKSINISKKQVIKKQQVREPEVIPRDRNEAHDLMNIKDDQQVIAEIRGQWLDEFVYHFETKSGNKVTGLSWAGTKEIARQQGNISIEDIDISETDDRFRVLAKSKDIARNVSMFGVAVQSKKMKLKTGPEIEDLHALSKCVSRAQRNAIRALIPEMFIKEMIAKFLKEKNDE